jgi:putative hydrolase of the HAD superfamily
MKSKIKAIYFDLDDTLCAYWAASRKGLRATFDEHGFNGETEKAVEAWRKVFKSFSPEVKQSDW